MNVIHRVGNLKVSSTGRNSLARDLVLEDTFAVSLSSPGSGSVTENIRSSRWKLIK